MNRFLRLSLLIYMCSSAYADYIVSGAPQSIESNVTNRLKYRIRENIPFSKQHADQIRYETIEAIKPFGYFEPNITVTPQGQDLKIEIELGKLTYIDSVTYTVNQSPTDHGIPKQIDGIINSFNYTPFSTENVNRLQQSVEGAVRSLGYSRAVVNRTHMQIDLTQQSNNTITLQVVPNQKTRFGQLFTADNEHAKCFDKFLTFQSGEAFTQSALNATQKNMAESGIFKDIQLTPVPSDQHPDVLDIEVDYTPLDDIEYSLGAGVLSSSDADSVFEPNLRANATINNLIDCGGKLINNISISDQDSTLSSDLVIPSPSEMDTFYLLSANIRSFKQQSDDIGKYFLASGLLHRHIGPIEFEPSVNYLIETSFEDTPQSYDTKMLYAKTKLKWSSKNANRYTLAKGKAMGAVSGFASDLTFARLSATIRNTISPKQGLIDTQLSYGEIITDDFNIFPLSMQFTLGGPASLRGIDYQQINQGKRFLLLRNSAQIRYKSILIGGFFDTGYCTNTDTEDYLKTTGLLLSYETPYSRFNLSVGSPTSGGSPVILFSIDTEVF